MVRAREGDEWTAEKKVEGAIIRVVQAYGARYDSFHFKMTFHTQIQRISKKNSRRFSSSTHLFLNNVLPSKHHLIPRFLSTNSSLPSGRAEQPGPPPLVRPGRQPEALRLDPPRRRDLRRPGHRGRRRGRAHVLRQARRGRRGPKWHGGMGGQDRGEADGRGGEQEVSEILLMNLYTNYFYII